MNAPYPAYINSIPDGLLSLLQLKQTGRNPSQFAEFVQPVMDLQAWYEASTAEIVASTTSAIAANGVTASSLLVPFNETWLLDATTFSFATAGTVTAARCYGTIASSNASGTFQLFPTNVVDLIGNEFANVSHNGKLLLRPGDAFTFCVNRYAGAGNITCQAYARIARLIL